MVRIGRLALLGSVTCVAGCMVQQPVGPYGYGYGSPYYGQPPSGAPLVLAPGSLPAPAPGGAPAPLGPPVATEPLAPPPGSNGQEDHFVPRPVPDDATLGNLQTPPEENAPPPNLVTPDQMGGTPPPVYGSADPSGPPDVGTPAPSAPSEAAPDPSIEQQLAAIKQNLARGASPPPNPEPAAHYHYGGLSAAGDVAPGSTSQ